MTSHRAEQLPPDLVQDTLETKPDSPYRVGPGDSLMIAVFRHPELSISTYAGFGASAGAGRSGGVIVDNDGTIQFPMLGTIKVAGKSTSEVRDLLQAGLRSFIVDPQITVQVQYTGSLRYYLLGEFNNPGLKVSDRPVRLLEALALGNSISLKTANLRGAYVGRRGKKLPVNFYRLLREGDLAQNIPLHSGDTIFVPDSTNEKVFVFATTIGTAAQGGPVPMVNGRLTLLQALAHAGLGFRERVQGRLKETRIIRSEADRGELFVVDADKILRGEAHDFPLQPGDIVFVPSSGVTNWNMALAQLTPTLDAISSVLNPFVQIAVLREVFFKKPPAP